MAPEKFLLKGLYFLMAQVLLGQSLQCTNLAVVCSLGDTGTSQGLEISSKLLVVNCPALEMQWKKIRNVQKRLIVPYLWLLSSWKY